mgnify:CR=1 FL=1
MEENSSNVSVVGLHRIYYIKDKERTEKSGFPLQSPRLMKRLDNLTVVEPFSFSAVVPAAIRALCFRHGFELDGYFRIFVKILSLCARHLIGSPRCGPVKSLSSEAISAVCTAAGPHGWPGSASAPSGARASDCRAKAMPFRPCRAAWRPLLPMSTTSSGLPGSIRK